MVRGLAPTARRLAAWACLAALIPVTALASPVAAAPVRVPDSPEERTLRAVRLLDKRIHRLRLLRVSGGILAGIGGLGIGLGLLSAASALNAGCACESGPAWGVAALSGVSGLLLLATGAEMTSSARRRVRAFEARKEGLRLGLELEPQRRAAAVGLTFAW